LNASPRFSGIDHIDTRVADLAPAEPFYDRLMPKLGLPRKRHACVDADGNWKTSSSGEAHNAVEYYEDGAESNVPRFIGFIEDAGMTPAKTRIAFRVAGREQLQALTDFIKQIGAKNVELSADMVNYPAVFFEDPAGTRLELCARPVTSE
jgi:catechol 2,3-dioxygenase-like lactoylglutathione lyase family enzyme